MPIQFQCSECNKRLQVSDESAGKQAKCQCGAVVKIPAASSGTVAPSAATAKPGTAKPTSANSNASAKASPTNKASTSVPSSKPKSAAKPAPASNLNNLFDELTDKDWQIKPASVPKAERLGQSDGAFLKAYAASSKSIDQSNNGKVAGAPPDSVRIRQEHLWLEANIKSFGSLYLFGGVLNIIAAVGVATVGAMALSQGGEQQTIGIIQLVAAGFYVAIGGFSIAFGKGLQNLAPWARVVGIVFACIGLLGIPLGTLISAFLLYLFLSQKGVYCFSAEYKKVVAATPEIKCPTPIWVWILLFLLVTGILVGVGLGVFAALNAT